MSEEILFRRAGFGGFNRDDVMQYISKLSAANGEKEKVEKELLKVKAELSVYRNSAEEIQRLKAENAALKAELDAKNSSLVSMKLELEGRKTQAADDRNDSADDASEQAAVSAERLMQDSMAYAERYIQSAELVAGNIRKDTLEKLNKAGSQLVQMRDTAAQLSLCSEKINLVLEKLSNDVNEAARGFERKEERT